MAEPNIELVQMAQQRGTGSSTGSLTEKVGDAIAPDGPLNDLYADKYKDIFLQWPLNLESAEENHWVRFDVRELLGAQIKQDEARAIGIGGAAGAGGGSFLDRIISNTAEKASALVNTALMAPINIAKSTVNEFLNDLPPIFGGIGRDLLGGLGDKGKARGLGSIMLYSPHTRQENLKYNWKGEAVGQAGAALQGGGGTVGGVIKNALGGNSETINSAWKNRGSLGQAGISAIVGSQFGADPQKMMDITFKEKGQAINPHLEMFFENVDFRTFTFDFKLAPRNAPEAKAIQEIVNLFKYASAPAYQTSSGGVFFTYPNVFEITFFNEAQTHKIATSALTQVGVNYTAAGVNSTFYDNYPVETQLNLTFTELEIMHKTKIDKGY